MNGNIGDSNEFSNYVFKSVKSIEWSMQEMSGGAWRQIAIGHFTLVRSGEKVIFGRTLILL